MTGTARLLGVTAIIAAAMLWGTTGTVQALLPPERQPLVVAALRVLIGALALLALALSSRHSRRAFAALPLPGVIFAGLSIGLYNLLFFLAVIEAGVGVGTAIAIGSAPVWVTLYEITVQRQMPGRLRAGGQLLAIAGACLLVFSGSAHSGTPFGYLLAAAAGAAYASYSLATSRISQSAPSATIAAATFSVAALALLPILFLVPIGWATSPSAWPGILFLGIGATAASYALYTWGLGRVTASTAVTLALAEPLTAWLLAIFVLDEQVTAARLGGAALLLAGLAIVTLAPRKRGGN